MPKAAKPLLLRPGMRAYIHHAHTVIVLSLLDSVGETTGNEREEMRAVLQQTYHGSVWFEDERGTLLDPIEGPNPVHKDLPVERN